jgi:hypothetical protein
MGQDRGGDGGGSNELFGRLLGDLEATVAAACERQDEWPKRVAAGIYAGVGYAIENPIVVDAMSVFEGLERAPDREYTGTIERLAGLISRDAPADSRLPVSTDEALVAGIVGVVGDHVRIGRREALEGLRPDLVLLALLPYLGFSGAQDWANRLAADADFV